MIEVFKTNIQNNTEARLAKKLLQDEFPDLSIHFDLEDCDKILRIEALNLDYRKITSLLIKADFYCEILEG